MVVGAVALVATGVGAVIGATAAAATTVAGIASVATIASVAGAAAGVLTLAAGLTAKKPIAQATGSPTDFSADPDAGIPLAIGRTGTAGDITARFGFDTKDKGDNDRQAFVATLSLGPIDAIVGQTVDKVATSYTATGAAIGALAGFMWSMTQLGAMPEASALGFGAGAGTPPGWTAQHKMSGKAAATWTLRFDPNGKIFTNGVPAPMWTLRGAKCYDPTKDSTYPGGAGAHRMADPANTAAYDAAIDTWEWSEDPYLLGLRWAHGIWQRDRSNPNSSYQRVMGMGANWSGIDVAAFVEGRNVAHANGWKVGGMIYSGDDKWDTMKKILQAGMGEPLALGARISCLVNAPKVTLANVTIDDVIGAASVAATQPRRSRINTITPRYRLEENNWQLLPGAPITVPEYVTADRGKRSKVQDYPFIQQTPQVATAVRYDIENAREFGPITLPLKLVWMGYKPGDCVTVTLPEVGLNAQPVLLLNRELDPSQGIVTMTARSETAGKHPYALGQTSTPPPTPGVSGPPLIPVPGAAAWAITDTSIDSASGRVPALVVAGARDASAIDGVMFDYRVFANSLGVDDAWISAGIDPPSTTNKVIGGVQAGAPYQVSVRYSRSGSAGNRLILGPIDTAEPVLGWPAITGPDRPADNATVGGTIGVDIKLPNGATPFPADIVNPRFDLSPDGRLTAIDFSGATKALGQIQIDKIGAASTAALQAAEGRLNSAISDTAKGAQDALGQLSTALGKLKDSTTDAFAIGDGARRIVEDAVDKLAAAQLAAALTGDSTRVILRNAGIYIDPASGAARIYGVDQAANAITEAVVRLSAVEGKIQLRVTRTDLDAAILAAQLGGANADLGPLLTRIGNAEVNLNALGAAIQLKADQTLVGDLAGRVTSVRADLDAATGKLALKADSATVTKLDARVSTAEATLTALGDVASYTSSATSIRLLDGQAADNAENTLRGLLAGDAAARAQVAQLGFAYQQLTSRIIDGDAAEAAQRNLLLTRVRDNEASVSTERLARVQADGAITGQIDQFRSDFGKSLALVNDQTATLAKDGTSTATTVRVMGVALDQDGNDALRSLLAGDASAVSAAKQIAVLRQETTTRMVAGEQSLVQLRQDFNVALGGNVAVITRQVSALTDQTQSIARDLATFHVSFASNTADVNARLVALATADQTLAGRFDAFSAGYAGNKAAVDSQLQALVAADQALSGRIDAFRSTFDGNTADVAAKLVALATADQTLSGRVDAFRSTYDGNTADVAAKLIALATADQTLSGRIDAFRSTYDDNSADVSKSLLSLADKTQAIAQDLTQFHAAFDGNAANVSLSLQALVKVDQTLAGRIEDYRATFAANAADVQRQLAAQADAAGAVAGSVDTLKTTVKDNTAKITESASSIDGLKLRKTLELDSNGHVTGIEANNDGTRGDLTIVTDALKVVRPGATKDDPGHTVFAIGDDGEVYILGKLRAGSIETDMLQVNAVMKPAVISAANVVQGTLSS